MKVGKNLFVCFALAAATFFGCASGINSSSRRKAFVDNNRFVQQYKYRIIAGEVSLGMPPAAVIVILGNPSEINWGKGNNLSVWTYKHGYDSANNEYVFFDNDKVVGWSLFRRH